MSIFDTLWRIVDALDAAGVPYMITGSVASSLHVAPRSTQDIDVVIDPTEKQLRALVASFPKDAWLADLDSALDASSRRSQFNVLEFRTGWKCDLIFKKPRQFSREEFERRRPIAFEGRTLQVATREDLIIAKLEWAAAGESQRQVEDAAMLLASSGTSLDMDYIGRWIVELGLGLQWTKARSLAGLD